MLIVKRHMVLLFLMLLLACASKIVGPASIEDGTHFSFYHPTAERITIVGSFNRWDRQGNPLSGPDKRGVWSVTLPLPAGRYEYLFLIDDKEWALDPVAPFVDDGAGGRNSLLIIR